MSFDKINFLTKEDSKGNKTIPLILLNVLAVLREDDQFKNHFRRNVFSGMVESDFGENSFINLTDVICSRVREKIMIDFPPFYALSALMVREAILTVADDIRVNPPRDWLESLSWDGEYRLENWISHTFQIPNEDRIQEIGRKWMIGLCARVLSPGCQMDEVLVFNGGEGGKNHRCSEF